MDDGVKLTLLGSWMALFVIFAGRKFTQPIKVKFQLLKLLLVITYQVRFTILNINVSGILLIQSCFQG